MATATTPEHVGTQARAEPVAANPSRERVQKISIDGNTLAVLGVGIALFTMAFGAFTHLSGRIDSLDTKIERGLGTLNGRIDTLDAKIERVATDLRTEIKDVHAKIDKLSAETNDRFDRLNEKITQILINQSRGQ